MKNSVLDRKSRYVSGGSTEVNADRLEWWERNTYDLSNTDKIITVDERTQFNPMRISEAELGDSRYWWVIMQYNAILDVQKEIVPGRILRIPSRTRLNSILTGKIGGFESAREFNSIKVLPVV